MWLYYGKHLYEMRSIITMLLHTPRVTLATLLDESPHSDLFELGSISSFN